MSVLPLRKVADAYFFITSGFSTATNLAFSALFAMPEFPMSDRDVLIYRASYLTWIFVALMLPVIIILNKSIRKHILLFNKEKLLFTILGWILLVVFGGILFNLISSLQSDQFKAENAEYHRGTEITSTASNDNTSTEVATSDDTAAKNYIITVTYGEAGDYGKAEEGLPYRYYIPSGNYNVTSITQNSSFFIIENSSDYYEDVIIEEVAVEISEEQNVNIPENTHIVLRLNSNVILEQT